MLQWPFSAVSHVCPDHDDVKKKKPYLHPLKLWVSTNTESLWNLNFLWNFLLRHVLTSPHLLLALRVADSTVPSSGPEDCHCLPFPSGNHFLKYEICLSGGNLSLCVISSHVCDDRTFVVIWEVFLCCKSQFVCDDAILGHKQTNKWQVSFLKSLYKPTPWLLCCADMLFLSMGNEQL